mmetsp:Transcript_38712/g.69351  ORF Transcript_38712/g.69351 Transcript_38712/m.69351 type:complete len:213 (+) Transcript_38712:348-986(+)
MSNSLKPAAVLQSVFMTHVCVFSSRKALTQPWGPKGAAACSAFDTNTTCAGCVVTGAAVVGAGCGVSDFSEEKNQPCFCLVSDFFSCTSKGFVFTCRRVLFSGGGGSKGSSSKGSAIVMCDPSTSSVSSSSSPSSSSPPSSFDKATGTAVGAAVGATVAASVVGASGSTTDSAALANSSMDLKLAALVTASHTESRSARNAIWTDIEAGSSL